LDETEETVTERCELLTVKDGSK